MHSRSVCLLVVFSAHLTFPLSDNEPVDRLLTILEKVATNDDGAPEPAAIVTLKNACVSAMKRSSAAGLSLSFAGHFEAIMNRVFLPGLLSINLSLATGSSGISGHRSSSTYRALYHKCAAELLRVGIETECLSRQRAAELLEKCIQSLAPRQESIEATISFLTKMIISSTTTIERDDVNILEKSNNDNITNRTVLMTRRISDLIHGKEGGGGGKGFLQPLAAVWMRPDFEVPRELYISLATSYLLPAPNAPTSSNYWE